MSLLLRVTLAATLSSFLIASAADAATVTGTVRAGAARTPLQAAVVDAYDAAGSLRGSATTDATGLYLFSQLAAGSYRFLAYDPQGRYATSFDGGAESFETTPVVTLSASSSIRIDFDLVDAGSIGGVIRSSAGAPLAGTVVEAYNLSGTRRGFTKTAADGTYNLVLPPGEFKIVAWDEGNVFGPLFHQDARTFSDAARVKVTAGIQAAVFISLDPAAHVRGTTVDAATLTPLAGVVVYAYTPAGALVRSAVTDSAGAFVLPLPRGEYRFVAADPSGTYASTYYVDASSFTRATPVTLAAGEMRNGVRLALVRGGIIAGRITSVATSAPLANITIGAYNADGTLHASATTAADGTYEIVVAPGRYAIAASDPAQVYAARFYAAWNEFRTAERVLVAATQRVTGIDLSLQRGGRFTGIAKSATAQPLSGITVTAYDAAGLLAATAKTAEDGRYSLVVAPGAYRLVASDDRLLYATAYAGGGSAFETSLPANVDAGATVSRDFVLHPGLRVTGLVTDRDGGALDGVEIFALDLDGNRVAGATSASGAFALAVRAGSYKFVAIDPSRRYRLAYYDGVVTLGEAKIVAVTAGQIPPPIAFALESAGGRRRSVRH